MDNPICVITEEHAYIEDGEPRCSVSTALAFEGDDLDEIIDGMIERFVREYYERSDESEDKIKMIINDAKSTGCFEREFVHVEWHHETFYV